MNLPDRFQFSQGSLQDFADCRRRFFLRYVQRLAWPAAEAEPLLENERFLLQGEAFHRLLQQHLLGVPAERLTAQVHEPELLTWWQNYRTFAAGLPSQAQRFPEISLSAPLGEFRLTAKYDLLLRHPDGRFTIYDWKTSRRRPPRKWLKERLQTRLYPCLLVQAGAALNAGQPLQPEQVEMIYWFAAFPDQPERFAYSPAQFRADTDFLARQVALIARLEEAEFTLTPDETRCRYCVYRSLCDRGAQAGPLEDAETEPAESLPFDLDFEQIGEIPF